MHREEAFKERFEKRARSGSICCAAEIGDGGLVLGARTVLARMKRDVFGSPVLALDEDGERLLALIGVASGRPPSSDVLRHAEGASAWWRRGEKSLANIRLAYARIPRIEDRADAYRLFLAETLLDDDISPRELTKALGLEALPWRLEKFDPSQPRVPAGSGSASGRWTREGTGAPAPAASSASSATAPTPKHDAPALGFVAAGGARTLAQTLFGEASGSTLLAGLATLGETVGAGIALGAIFVPSPNKSVTDGAVPGKPGLFYHFDAPAGVLQLFRKGSAAREVVANARLERNGIYVDAATGKPIARTLGGSLAFDADSLADATGAPREKAEADEPKFCPKPEPDTPHGAKEAAWAYEDLIKKLMNPLQPTPRGWGVNLSDPTTEKPVFFDDCRRSDGTMIEVKGPGFAEKLRKRFFIKTKIFPREWKKRAEKQVPGRRAASPRMVFAEPEAADVAGKTFESVKELKGIRVFYVPAETP